MTTTELSLIELEGQFVAAMKRLYETPEDDDTPTLVGVLQRAGEIADLTRQSEGKRHHQGDLVLRDMVVRRRLEFGLAVTALLEAL